jgi:LmbE family N-acetylglucosaminyl deacetylase
MRNGSLFLLLLCIVQFGWAQPYELKSTVDIYQDIQSLQRGLRVLYLAAHPDDENTRLISWLENAEHVETAYLSLTRGQGGQNLIGDEKGDALGVIRTYELLEARKVDGAEQFFTRAIDFGYSKSAEESFDFWGKDEVLHDVVYVIRKYRPHVIITRFPPTRRAGHGHHEASAILAEEAFELAADASAYPDQLQNLQPWQPTVLYHNTSSWWDKSLIDLTAEELAEKKMHRINIGVYNDLLGMGMNEIASIARSKHRCQAFGTPRRRGVQEEYLQFVKGEWSPYFLDSLAGVWQQSPEHAEAIQRWLDAFNFTNREANLETFKQTLLPKLAQRNMWAESQDMQDVYAKVNSIKHDLSGMRVEVYTDKDPVVVGTTFPVTVEVYNSGSIDQEIEFKHEAIDTSFTVIAGDEVSFNATLSAPMETSNPFWLDLEHDNWLYRVPSKNLIGVPAKEAMEVPYLLKVDGQFVNATTPVHRRWNDRSIGEISDPLVFVNPVSINPSVNALVLREGAGQTISVDVVAHQDLENIGLTVDAPSPQWKAAHHEASFSLKKGQVRTIQVKIEALAGAQEGNLNFHIQHNGARYYQRYSAIDYEHLPFIGLHESAYISLTPLDLQLSESKRILYIEGSGDEVDEATELLGYEVDREDLTGMTLEDLKQYDVVVTGIRAFNRNESLAANIDVLRAYMMQGGHLVVQYNTTYDLNVEQIGPYPMELSRDRVTDETSDVDILLPKHPIFNTPNQIGADDWTAWVQERGLYFAGEWDKEYQPLIAWSDKGEEPVKGGLLHTNFGKGSFVYTGISFFRQLPAGVPGAYRLWVNILEYEQPKK